MRKAFVTILLLLLLAAPALADSAVTITQTPPFEGPDGVKAGPYIVYLDITAAADGSVSDYSLPLALATTLSRGWYLFCVRTVPDGTTPMTNLYDITVVDPFSLDLMGGALLNRSSSVAEQAKPAAGIAQPVICPDNDCSAAVTITVANNAVNAGKTKVVLLFARYD